MLLNEKELLIPRQQITPQIFAYLERQCLKSLGNNEFPVRFVITKTDDKNFHCEIGTVACDDNKSYKMSQSIFDFNKRQYENSETFNAALVIPTGIGCEIGGHAGDANAVARLVASACDTLITHPNVVNASDINELPDNGLYVEGSVISRLLQGNSALKKVRSNRILTIMDKRDDPRLNAPTINAVSAARATMGVDCVDIISLDPPLKMSSHYTNSGRAAGKVENMAGLCQQLDKYAGDYDAIAVASVIELEKSLYYKYIAEKGAMVNPWGGIEAMLTHTVSMLYNMPSAHAPMIEDMEMLCMASDVVEPRMAAEEVSCAFIHCVLKGLHKSPRIIDNRSLFHAPGIISAKDISCLIIPEGCLGLPTIAASLQGIPVIIVKENKNYMRNNLTDILSASNQLFFANNYLEVIGIMNALKTGVSLKSLKRPTQETNIY